MLHGAILPKVQRINDAALTTAFKGAELILFLMYVIYVQASI